jgi:hypothetical protein
VEKYINTGTGAGQHGKSWQFLSVATSGQTIRESWMENGSKPGGYGTMISGPAGLAAGFDIYSVAPSMKFFNDSVNNWTGVSGANNLIANTAGYMIFIRGDRDVVTTTQASNPTVLRSKGQLFTGTQLPITVRPNKFQSIGNPYASPIDFSLITKDEAIDDAFYIYDPYLYGTYGAGGYQTLSAVNNWKPVPGGTSAYPTTVLSSIIQPGQAFFVHSHDANPGNVTLTEDAKSNTSRPGHSNRETGATGSDKKQFLRASLITGNGLMADGNVVAFGKTYRDDIDGNDAIKIVNSGENFAVKSSGKLLTIEARSPLSADDTIYYNISNLNKTNYRVVFAPENIEAVGLQAFLVDKFLNTESNISLSDSTFMDVQVTSNAASKAADRFAVVFRTMTVLPVTFTSVKAYEKNAGVEVEWKVENESEMLQYEVEKSLDGNNFNKAAVVAANNNGVGIYNWVDKTATAGTFYYRIRSISKDGKSKYTQVIKVVTGKQQGAISVYPNPIVNETINLQFSNQPAGEYKIRLINQLGQAIISKKVTRAEVNGTEVIQCDHNLAKGIYQLEIVKADGSVEVIKVMN